ncbi:NACHT domain-containing protein [Nocardia salmonicida]|uniref:NACHT domain-containing protein n=1 Tax=Nocardia salmonicida TaxID=53431 RepID=UPI0037A02C08
MATIVADTQAALARNGIPEPGNLRWPMRVDLSQYAEELAATPDKSLFAHLSNAIAMRTDAAITASDLQSWLRAWPWVVILDGLDEVSTVNQRRVLLERVTDFIETADSLDADLMLVATTRPLGYDERFDPDLFDNIWLRKLDQRQAMSFASEMVHHRLGDDPDLADRVIKRLSTASGESATRRLMETPLQVAIMSFIVEGYGALPVDRFGMFSLYYRTVYQREVDKPSSPLTRMLNAHRSDINYLHERVALQLHVAAEAGSTKPTIPLDQLEMLVRRRLQAQGYEPRQVDTITTQLVETATHRLVLLIPEGQHVGFEIRSLQELLAALAMTNGPENRALQQLRLTMHHPHWRNIWLLAAGRLFKEREHLHTELHDILTHGDGEATPLFQVMPSAPTLACDILDDGFASQAPLSRRRYLRQALRAIDYPAGPSHRLATAVARACQNNDDRDLVFSVLADAMRQTDVRQINAYTLAAWLGSADPGLDSRSERFIKHQRVHLSEQSRQVLASKPPAKKLSELIWRTRTSHRDDSPLEVVLTVLLAQHELENQTDTLGLDADEVASLATVLQSVIDRTSQAGSASATDDGLAFVAGSETGDGDGVGGLDDLAEAQVAALLQSLPPRAWQMVILVSAALGPYLVRRAVGAQILVAFED